jgi:replicative DNA helicase
MRQGLAALGLLGLPREQTFLPDAYLSADRQARLDLLCGLLSAGGADPRPTGVQFSTTSCKLANGLVALARSLGGLADVTPALPSEGSMSAGATGPQSFVVRLQALKTEDRLSLPPGVAAASQPGQPRRLAFDSIRCVRRAPVQCVAVSHSQRLYVTDDYVVTHNTALATNIAFHVARNYAYDIQPDGSKKTANGGVVAFFSLEMSAEQLAMRLLAEVSGVSSDRLRKGEIDQAEFGRVRDAALEIQESPLFIDATGGLSIAKLAARARRLKRSSGLDLIVVDYLQLVTGSDLKTNDNRVQEVSQITQGLKALAKELSVPILALSQLSRQVENREDKKPQLSDLRESGSIEQDADAVMFVYRESYYLGRTEPREGTSEHLTWQEEMDKVQGLAEVIIGKQRHGPIGTVRLHFNEELTKFGNLAREGRYDPR